VLPLVIAKNSSWSLRVMAGDAFTHLDVIDAANRRDFHRLPAKKNFVHDVQHFARDDLFPCRESSNLRRSFTTVVRVMPGKMLVATRSVERAVVDEETRSCRSLR